jgi:hypothetical protein
MSTASDTPFVDLPLRAAGVVLTDPPWNFCTISRKDWRNSPHAPRGGRHQSDPSIAEAAP